MKTLLAKLLIGLRMMQLYYHNCHHLCKGQSFLSDHNLFGDFYQQMETDYDDAAERFIGLYGCEAFPMKEIATKAAAMADTTLEVANMYRVAKTHEASLLMIVSQIDGNKEASPGTKQLVGEIGNKSEMRVYKINQRTEL